MEQSHKLITEYVHTIQQRLEQGFSETGAEETSEFYSHRFVAELLEDIKGAISDISECKEPSKQTLKMIDSQFWDKI